MLKKLFAGGILAFFCAHFFAMTAIAAPAEKNFCHQKSPEKKICCDFFIAAPAPISTEKLLKKAENFPIEKCFFAANFPQISEKNPFSKKHFFPPPFLKIRKKVILQN